MDFAIITNSGWRIYPHYNEQDKKTVGRIFSENIVPKSGISSKILEELPSLTMYPPLLSEAAIPDGYPVLVTGSDYIIYKNPEKTIFNKYDLKNYGLKGLITWSGKLHLIMRPAHFKEKFIFMPKDIHIAHENYKPYLNNYWFQVEKL